MYMSEMNNLLPYAIQTLRISGSLVLLRQAFIVQRMNKKHKGILWEKNWSRVCENEKYVTESVAFRLFNQEQHSN